LSVLYSFERAERNYKLLRSMVASSPLFSEAVFVLFELEGCTSLLSARSHRARDRSIRRFIHLLMVVLPSVGGLSMRPPDASFTPWFDPP